MDMLIEINAANLATNQPTSLILLLYTLLTFKYIFIFSTVLSLDHDL